MIIIMRKETKKLSIPPADVLAVTIHVAAIGKGLTADIASEKAFLRRIR